MYMVPGVGYTASEWGCFGTYELDYGLAHCTADGVEFESEASGVASSFDLFDLNSGMVPVEWGERHYLLHRNEVQPFCNAVNARKFRKGGQHGFLLREQDHGANVSGLPNLPGPYQRCFSTS